MHTISLPQKIEVKELQPGREAEITIEPCFPGYGTTLGNALRRVLLSSLSGAAVTAMKIKGVQHEFSTIPHVKEDVVDIIQNVKLLRLKVFGEGVVTVTLKTKGEKVVTGADMQKNAEVEVLNPEQEIATITDEAGLFEMELTVQNGVGYSPVETREKQDLEIGTIAIDALFNPVLQVSFRKEDVRVGQMTNFDKLVLTIRTDGTMTPAQAFEQSAEILVDHCTLLRDFTKEGEKFAEKKQKEEEAETAEKSEE